MTAYLLGTRRRAMLWWTVAIAAVAAMYTAFYPVIGGMQIEGMLESFPDAVLVALGWDAFTSGAGYVNATVFSLVGAVLTLTCGIGAGARLIAGEEERGLLELELAAPVSRGAVYWHRIATLWVFLLGPAGGVLLVVGVLDPVLSLEIPVGHLVAATVALWLFAGAIGTVTYAIGAITGRRAHALAAGSGLAVASYLLAYLGPLAELDWMTNLSPYWWYVGDRPLLNGADWVGMAALVVLGALAATAGIAGFVRRDTNV
ncbi:hypothetical protein OEB99_18350 [Actinotalea sp. M2MS4P-6]|uniref:ABC transporter permease subunit n=1 Tax=Actinotalea sp. M2MS4P-6 TaxID=2983762 RepID=UPI0021E49A40|nr:ABC transporter permease subunit [Actinotalea sp. M2MS4P-6]MCV2396276.1 hypothetical protein [Actinotalea sp. M2MS4P-6]